MGGVHACMTAGLYPHAVACTPLLAPRSAAVAYCDGALQPLLAMQPLLSEVDLANNSVHAVVSSAACAVSLLRDASHALKILEAIQAVQKEQPPIQQQHTAVSSAAGQQQAVVPPAAHMSTVIKAAADAVANDMQGHHLHRDRPPAESGDSSATSSSSLRNYDHINAAASSESSTASSKPTSGQNECRATTDASGSSSIPIEQYTRGLQGQQQTATCTSSAEQADTVQYAPSRERATDMAGATARAEAAYEQVSYSLHCSATCMMHHASMNTHLHHKHLCGVDCVCSHCMAYNSTDVATLRFRLRSVLTCMLLSLCYGPCHK